jgi:hypothetical protein
MTTGEDSFRDKPDVRNLRQASGKASAPSKTHSTPPIACERDDVPSLHVNPVSKTVFPSVFILPHPPRRVMVMTKMEL